MHEPWFLRCWYSDTVYGRLGSEYSSGVAGFFCGFDIRGFAASLICPAETCDILFDMMWQRTGSRNRKCLLNKLAVRK
jgi:hypothetical protein